MIFWKLQFNGQLCYVELQRARDLFYALWIPDLFMRRCEADGMWSLMCPNECPGLQDCWGEKFDKLYERYSFYFGHIRQRDVSVHSTEVDKICLKTKAFSCTYLS